MKLLFICTHNRCRSILAEAVTRQLAGGRIEARSAGSQPAGEVHPLSLKYLEQRNIPTESLSSNSWHEFESWQPDVVITVCDSAAAEQCPLWLGNAIKVHWGLADPSRLEASAEAIGAAFNRTIDRLQQRINELLTHNFEGYSATELKRVLEISGSCDGKL